MQRRQFLTLLAGLPAFSASARRRIPPVDESAVDPAFARFAAKLRQAATAGDRAAVAALSIPDLEVERQDLPELARALAFGSARFDKGFAFPYWIGKFPEALDPFEHAVTIRAGAVLRARPDETAPAVAPLDYDIVHVPVWRPDSRWQQVRRLDGPAGYVRGEDLRTCGHFHGYCERRGGVWKLVAFTEGD